MPAIELNLDGIVGPTHNYAGLALGNLASAANARSISNPRAAALQGLAKMKFLSDMGIPQAVLLPPVRPDVQTLRRLGFGGSAAHVLDQARREAPDLLAACASASSMWAANAATISPGADCADGRAHFTPANLLSHLHRSIETRTTARVLRAIFADPAQHGHHQPLPRDARFSDEGAANHLRLAPSHGAPGLEIFVYGRANTSIPPPQRFAARQSLDASQAIARLHLLDPQRTMFVRQNPAAVDAGVFHADVAAVANENVLLYHERAFADAPAVADEICRRYASITREDPLLIAVTEGEVPLAEAIASYLFNSQLVTLPAGGMAMICPIECREAARTRAFLEELPQRCSAILEIHFVDVRQSMRNGGGPACLRLRVVLTEPQLHAMHAGVRLTDALYDVLCAWVRRHYREQLSPPDLADPELLREARAANDELARLLDLRVMITT